jgi:hypothetical protein
MAPPKIHVKRRPWSLKVSKRLFNALPREGHLEALYHMFAYLAKADEHLIVFDASLPDLKPSTMVATDWTDFYGDV